MNTLLQDVRYALRLLRKSPGFTAVAVLTLALGIGANTAIFSVIENVLLRPLPYDHPHQLIEIWNTYLPAVPFGGLSAGDFQDWRTQAATVSDMAGFSWLETGANLTGDESPQRVTINYATANLFPLLGTKPAVGRLLLPAEDRPGSAPIVILSHHFWQSRFGSDPGVLGRAVTLDGLRYSIIGVLSASSGVLDSSDLWMPLGQFGINLTNHTYHDIQAIARLKLGVTIAQARAEFEALNRQSAAAYPAPHKGFGVLVRPMQNPAAAQMRQSLLVLFAAVGLVLLIACANIVNLLLARNAAREKEIALRIAIGASSRRLVRQLLTESMLLAFTGGALGLALAAAGVNILSALAPANLSFLQTSHLDNLVFLFTLGVCVLVGIICGLLPALQVCKMNVNDALKQGSKGTSALSGRKLHSFVVISEIALALVPLVGAGLLLRSLHDLLNVSPGFRADHLLTMHVPIATIPDDAYNKMAPAQQQAATQKQSLEFLQIVQQVHAIPGVKSAAGISRLPLGAGLRGTGRFVIEGRPIPDAGVRPIASTRVITPSYFSTAGIPLLRGRALTQEDWNASNIDINETMARRFWPDGNALGKRLNFCSFEPKPCWFSIIGIVGNVHQFGLDAAPTYDAYFCNGWTDYLLIRTSSDPHLVASAATTVVHKIDPMLPVDAISTMSEILDNTVSPRRFSAILISIFAALALVLAAIGVYGVMSYMIGRRTGEMGIRMALGAQPRDVLRLVLGHGAKLALWGIVIGAVGAFLLTRLMAGLLYGVNAGDPFTFIGVAVLLTIVALASCYIPARRAMRVDPMVALRHE
ncbi:MAG TPA: ABC transporter permease [Candidatus Acidoferrales bacterium]|nr:ABC transporter permease [Candidatus Acidoferrales bacterium]